MAQIRSIAPELQEVANCELNEDEATIFDALCEFRCWIESQPHLKARTNDQFLIAFLRFCKYDQEAAQKRIEYFYNYKSTAGDLCSSRQIDDKLLAICRSGIFATPANPIGPGGPRIHITRMGKVDVSLFSVKEIFRYHMFRSEIEINTDDNWVIAGVVEILDFSKISYSLLRQFDPSLFKKMAAFLEYGVPTNLKATHIINASKEAQIILQLVRLAMKQKELLHIHSNLESLHKVIDKQYLPVEYGGCNGTLDEAMANFEELLLTFTDYFLEDDQYGVIAEKNPNTKTKKSSKK